MDKVLTLSKSYPNKIKIKNVVGLEDDVYFFFHRVPHHTLGEEIKIKIYNNDIYRCYIVYLIFYCKKYFILIVYYLYNIK